MLAAADEAPRWTMGWTMATTGAADIQVCRS